VAVPEGELCRAESDAFGFDAQASHMEVSLATRNGSLVLSIRDDGIGGADPSRGSGLVGLQDRVEALGGTFKIESRPGGGTSLVVTLTLDAEPTG
jgi:signal transduction histidine kinase